MPSSYHYPSTNSVSSLSISSMSSSSCESDLDSANDEGSQHTSLTSWSKAGRRGRTASTTSWYGRPPTGPRTPSPLEANSEDEDEDGDGFGNEFRPIIGAQRSPLNQQSRFVRSWRAPPIIEDRRGHGHERAVTDERPSYPASAPLAYDSIVSAPPSSEARPATRPLPSDPASFSKYFPSDRPLTISHPQCEDGNVNLSVDTQTRDGPLTLFHLRMHNLRAREFSLRRYGRDSGREICKSTRRRRKAPGAVAAEEEAAAAVEELESRERKHEGHKRKGSVARSVVRSIDGMLGKQAKERRESEASNTVVLHQQTSLQSPVMSPKKPDALRRSDSGYSSAGSGSTSPSPQAEVSETRTGFLWNSGLEYLAEEPEEYGAEFGIETSEHVEDPGVDEEAEGDEDQTRFEESFLSNGKIKLEFSNYTHLDVRRHGPLAGTRKHDFEYWGVKYSWKRVVQTKRRASAAGSQAASLSKRRHSLHTLRDLETGAASGLPETEYHLCVAGKHQPIATIVPKPLSSDEKAFEADMGSWVPVSLLRIHSEEVWAAHNAADVCDVIVATGLLALTDDCIRRRWNESQGTFTRLLKMSPAFGTNLAGNWLRMDKIFGSKKSGLGKTDKDGVGQHASDDLSSIPTCVTGQ